MTKNEGAKNKKIKQEKNTSFKEIKKSSSLDRLDFELLLAFASGLSRETLITYPNKNIGLQTLNKFHQLERKRLKNWPIAYLLGEQNFYGLNFKVSPKVLVPRPETELIIDEVLKKISENNSKVLNIIDLGTGSGAIIISLASKLKKINIKLFKETNFFGLDISPTALKITKENAKNNNLKEKIIFRKSNLLNIIKNKKFSKEFNIFSRPLIICANLPYLKPEEFKNEKSISREPKIALVAGKVGLKYYRELFKQLASITKGNFDDDLAVNKLKSLFLICEINPNQVEPMKKLANKYLGKKSIKIKKDLAQFFRYRIVS